MMEPYLSAILEELQTTFPDAPKRALFCAIERTADVVQLHHEPMGKELIDRLIGLAAAQDVRLDRSLPVDGKSHDLFVHVYFMALPEACMTQFGDKADAIDRRLRKLPPRPGNFESPDPLPPAERVVNAPQLDPFNLKPQPETSSDFDALENRAYSARRAMRCGMHGSSDCLEAGAVIGQLLNELRAMRARLETNSTAVVVQEEPVLICTQYDRACGDRPAAWCDHCPKQPQGEQQ